MNKHIRSALVGGIIFIFLWAILAGVSIAHDNGSFESWYRNVFRHPTLIGLICGLVAAVFFMLLCKPKKPWDVLSFLASILICSFILNGIAILIHDQVGGPYYSGNTDLLFWGGRLQFIFTYMVITTLVAVLVMMFAVSTKERRNYMILGAILGASMWPLTAVFGYIIEFIDMHFGFDYIVDFYAIFDFSPSLIIVPYLVLVTFPVLKSSELIKSYKQLALFGITALMTNHFIAYAQEKISWWDGVDNGFGLYFMTIGIYISLLVDLVLLAIDLKGLKHKK